MKQILIAFDGSTGAEKAFVVALDLAAKYGAELHILAVSTPPEFGGEVETEAIIEHSKQHFQQVLKPLHHRVEAAGVKAHFHVLVGHPAEQIVRQAEGWGVDLIVIGHRGHSLFEHWLVGSIAKRVLVHAPCSVLVAR